jgi:hypothetical protein
MFSVVRARATEGASATRTAAESATSTHGVIFTRIRRSISSSTASLQPGVHNRSASLVARRLDTVTRRAAASAWKLVCHTHKHTCNPEGTHAHGNYAFATA